MHESGEAAGFRMKSFHSMMLHCKYYTSLEASQLQTKTKKLNYYLLVQNNPVESSYSYHSNYMNQKQLHGGIIDHLTPTLLSLQ